MQHARETQIMMDMMVTWFEGEALIGCLEGDTDHDGHDCDLV